MLQLGAAEAPLYEHQREERERHQGELLEQHCARKAGGAPAVAGARDEREREHEQEEARRVVLAEPGRADRDRVADEDGAYAQPPGERGPEGERREEGEDGAEENEEAEVVERSRQPPPGRSGHHGAGEVREVTKRHLAIEHLRRHRAVEGVEALQAVAPVVVPVWVVAVKEQLATELDLVGRVVGEEPGRRGVAQTELEQRGGQQEEQRDDDYDARADPRGPAAAPEQRDPGRAAHQGGYE